MSEIVDVGELGAGLSTPGHRPTQAALGAVRAAKLLIVATPTYKGSYTGELGARVADAGLTVVEADLPRAADIVAEYVRTAHL